MAAKVKWYRGAWHVDTHHAGKRTKHRVGPTKADKRDAEQIAKKVNAAIALGSFATEAKAEKPLRCDEQLRRWLDTYSPTLKATYVILTRGLIGNHLAPHFGSRDLREIREADLLDFVRAKRAAGLAPGTIRNALSALRRVYSLLEREGVVSRNPAARIGELMRRVERASATQTKEVPTWSRSEVGTLLQVAAEHEPRFAPLLHLLFATGMRRGEALGLQWADVDFDAGTISVRRAITTAGLSTPKGGRSRRVAMTPSLASDLFDVLTARRREALANGWADAPEWVFVSETGTSLDPANVERMWRRVRRRAQKHGVRPLKLHAARHTWATLALAAGKSVRWVADQARPRRSCAHPARVRARDPRGGGRRVVRGLRRRSQTALCGPGSRRCRRRLA